MTAWSWLTDSLHRLQPATRPSRAGGQFALDAARGERLSCQGGVRVAGNDRPVAVSLSCRPAAGLSVRVRRVGYPVEKTVRAMKRIGMQKWRRRALELAVRRWPTDRLE